MFAALAPHGASSADRYRGRDECPAAAERVKENFARACLTACRLVVPLGAVAEQLVETEGHVVMVAFTSDSPASGSASAHLRFSAGRAPLPSGGDVVT